MSTPEAPIEMYGYEEALVVFGFEYDNWDFDGHSDEENARFILAFTRGIIDVFGWDAGIGKTDIYTDEIPGADLPSAIQPTLATLPGKNSSLENATVLMKKAGPFTFYKPEIPKFDELMKIWEESNIREMLKAAASDQEIIEGLKPPSLLIDDMTYVYTDHGFGYSAGLVFKVSSYGINVASHGMALHIWPDAEFVKEHGTDPTLLYRTVCELGLASARFNKDEERVSKQPIQSPEVLTATQAMHGVGGMPTFTGDFDKVKEDFVGGWETMVYRHLIDIGKIKDDFFK